ncbi:preprotein translocase subunit SecE [Candidatus Jorgensenbacteria bacterium RIFCSPLOWO2_01_FULL_45_25b]|uniref:Protein translocase subunit SecE n=1 Tax=Candidatus Jorgensenbacteria bacterium RIFCSPLOWO2_01_FULL_45_25b TaxID=1798471 RepID=A0A1F6C020_9BACT|nr:MAG: preprotein translocase subunit SecE [Candidatus Jorgensenbacteria bacterium RIFCSPLOWO2_01_FULL_45_25b]
MSEQKNKLSSFLEESKQELKKVNWPSRKETIKLTVFVIIFSLLVSAFLGALDVVFLKILEQVVNR